MRGGQPTGRAKETVSLETLKKRKSAVNCTFSRAVGENNNRVYSTLQPPEAWHYTYLSDK